jgi:hypothetical protein
MMSRFRHGVRVRLSPTLEAGSPGPDLHSGVFVTGGTPQPAIPEANAREDRVALNARFTECWLGAREVLVLNGTDLRAKCSRQKPFGCVALNPASQPIRSELSC